MHYTILRKNLFYDLPEEVNRYMEDGWKPQGGPYFFRDDNGNQCHCQAMIKDE